MIRGLFLTALLAPTVGIVPATAAEVGAADTATLRVDVIPLRRAPSGEREPVDDRPVRVVVTASEPRIDGDFEDMWRSTYRGPPPRSLRHGPPPRPEWGFNAMATPGGLAVGLRALPRDAHSVLAVDPNGSRTGWIRVTLKDGRATQADCRADPTDADGMPVRHKWSVYTWDCTPEAPALAAHGTHGWEILVPWSTLEPTSDDLRLQWWVRTDAATASYDMGGAQREYAAAARPIEVVGRPERRDTVYGKSVPSRGVTVYTLTARDLDAAEMWTWRASSNGRTLASGRVALTPAANRIATADVEVDVPDVDGISFVASRDTGEPLRPGVWAMPWSTTRRGTLATPVHRDHVEVRTYLASAEGAVPVEVRRTDGTLLGVATVDLPAGTAQVRVERAPGWPEHVEVRVGDLIREGWLPSVHRAVR